MYDDRQLLEIELEATYQLDENGRFTDPKATRFFLGQTRSGNVRRFRNDQPDELIKEIDAIIAQEPVVSDLRAGLSHFEEYQRILSKWDPVRGVARGLGYRYPEKLTRFPDAVRVDQTNIHLAAHTFPWLLEEFDDWQPCLAVVDDGKFVSVCLSVRISAMAHVAGVNTLEDYRRKGYATAVAVEWGIAVRELGLIPIYSTELDNEASQGVATKAGLLLYNADHHFK